MNFDRIILGEDCVYTTDCDITQLNNNVIVCASSGCGKSMSISEPLLLETYNSSLVASIAKRKIYYKYAPIFISRGYNVWDMNYADPVNSNVAYDLLKYIHNYADIRFLAEAIVYSGVRKRENQADPYWNEAAISLLSAEIAFILMTKENPSFSDVLELHESIEIEDNDGLIKTSLDARFAKIARKDPHCFAMNCWRSFQKLPIKTAACVFGTLNTTIDSIFSSDIRKMMKIKKKVDFVQLATEKTILFITTSSVNPALHCLVNLFYSQLFKSLFEYAEKMPDGTLPVPVRVLCDDFAVGSKIMNFPEYISIFREKRLSVVLLLQSESQLNSMYGPNDATTIITNCDSFLYMGGMDLNTAKSISVRLNVPLDEILYMPVGSVVLFRRGQRPIKTKRYNIQNNPLYRQITAKYEKSIADRQKHPEVIK